MATPEGFTPGKEIQEQEAVVANSQINATQVTQLTNDGIISNPSTDVTNHTDEQNEMKQSELSVQSTISSMNLNEDSGITVGKETQKEPKKDQQDDDIHNNDNDGIIQQNEMIKKTELNAQSTNASLNSSDAMNDTESIISSVTETKAVSEQNESNSDPKPQISSTNNISIIGIILSIIIAFLYNMEPELVKPIFHCPPSRVNYVIPSDITKREIINGSHSAHPLNTIYSWDIYEHNMTDEFLINYIDGKDKSILKLPPLTQFDGNTYIKIKLFMSTISHNKYNFNKTCNITVTIHDLKPPEPIFYCPRSIIGVAAESKKIINASHDGHPIDTHYLWSITDHDMGDIISEHEIIGSILSLPPFEEGGHIKIKLNISVTLNQRYNFNKICNINIKVRDPIPPSPPKFHCPSSIITYVVPEDDTQRKIINVSHIDHPLNTIYSWDIIEHNITDTFLIYYIDGKDTSILKLPPLTRFGDNNYIKIKLFMSALLKNRYTFNKTCNMIIIIRDPKPEEPTFHCPTSIIKIPTELEKIINASHVDHPIDTNYLWNITDHDMEDVIAEQIITGSILKLPAFEENGYIIIKLNISVTLKKKYNFHQICDIQITIRDPKPPKEPIFHCPPSTIYISTDSSQIINASHIDHSIDTKYFWDINFDEIDGMEEIGLIDGMDTDILQLPAFSSSGNIKIKLSMSVTLKKIYKYKEKCDIEVIIHDKPVFGIDLGTTYSCISYQKNKLNNNLRRNTRIVISDRKRNEYCIPSAIYFDFDGKVLVGNEAINKLEIDPKNVIYDIKRIVGRAIDDEEIEYFKESHLFKIDDDNQHIFIPNLNKSIVFEQALSVILSYLVEIASIDLKLPLIRDVVVSIPALFHNGQRKGIRSACHLSGLNPLSLVIEPTAASLAHSYYNTIPDKRLSRFLAFDFGGGTLDASVMGCTGVQCQVLSVTGNPSLGGVDFDNVIKNIIIDKFKKKHNWFINKDNMSENELSKILRRAENVKCQLSDSSQSIVVLTNKNGIKKQVIITKKEFENHKETKQLIENALNLVDKAINHDVIKEDIRMILMIGGTSKIPIIQQSLINRFGDILEFPSIDPQLMVVTGSGIIGGSLAYIDISSSHITATDILLNDVVPLPLGIAQCVVANDDDDNVECGIMKIIIDKNTNYPTTADTVFCQEPYDADTLELEIYEGENYYVKNNYLLGNVLISDISERDPNICDNIIFQFIIDQDGIAKVEAKTNPEYGSVKKYNITINIDSKIHGTLTKQNVNNIRQSMKEWYHESKHPLIKKAFTHDIHP